ncbi:MAG: hypothetical protein ACXVFU_03685 [Nocardioidaceae bacterium]
MLDGVAATGVRDVLVPGDMVDGHWARDTAGTGIFGPLGTTAAKVASVRLAARTYLGAYRKELRSRGLRVFEAVGDHDLGDNPWTVGKSAWHTFKHRCGSRTPRAPPGPRWSTSRERTCSARCG